MPPKESTPNLLLVEGLDDQHVIWSLCEQYRLPEDFTVEYRGGINVILESLRVQLRATGLKRLGIVVDADEDLDARWQSLRGHLERAGYINIPTVPDPTGTILVQDDLPVFGVWLMPNNTLPGMLEDFVRFLVPQGDRLWGRAGEAIDGIPIEDKRFKSINRNKAHIHTWLAWQEEPGKPLGLAITMRYLDANAAEANAFINWLRRLYEVLQL